MTKVLLPLDAIKPTRRRRQELHGISELDVVEASVPLAMTPARMRAALLCAEGTMTIEAIAATAGVTSIALYGWRKRAEFQAVVARRRAELEHEFMEQGLAQKWQRIRILHGQLEKMIALQSARAEAGASASVRGVGDPGEETGMLAPMVNPKGIPYTVTDTALVREIRETLKMISQELGQWQTKLDVTSGGQPIKFTIPMSDDNSRVIDGEWTAGGLEGTTDVKELNDGQGVSG